MVGVPPGQVSIIRPLQLSWLTILFEEFWHHSFDANGALSLLRAAVVLAARITPRAPQLLAQFEAILFAGNPTCDTGRPQPQPLACGHSDAPPRSTSV